MRKGHAPQNLSALRKLALCLLRQDTQYPKRSLRSRRKTADRLPEQAGLVYWTDKMEAGDVTIANVAYAILDGARNEDLCVIVNKLLASNMFTAALGTAEEIAAYGNAGLIGLGNVAKEWLSAINSSNPSVHVAESKLGTLLHDLVGRWNDSGIDLIQIPGEILDTNSAGNGSDSLDFAALTARTGMDSLPDVLSLDDAREPSPAIHKVELGMGNDYRADADMNSLPDALPPDDARDQAQLIGYVDPPENLFASNPFAGYDAFANNVFLEANACLMG